MNEDQYEKRVNAVEKRLVFIALIEVFIDLRGKVDQLLAGYNLDGSNL